MGIASSDRDDVFQTRRNQALTGSVVAPANHRAAIEEGDGMTPTSGDGAHVLKSGWNIELPVVVGAPGRNRAVGQ